MTKSTVPTCGNIIQTGNYDEHWASKICTRIHSPVPAILTSMLSMLSGVEFTGSYRRYMILTPVMKGLVGYVLVRRYSKDITYALFGAALFAVVPDYSYYYFTQAKGLSFVLLWLGVYTIFRWSGGDYRWSLIFIIITATLSLFYLPRSLILISTALFISLKRIYALSRAKKSVVVILSGLILYVLQGELLISHLSTFLPQVYTKLPEIFQGSSSSIPYEPISASGPPIGFGYIMLTPIALIGVIGFLIYVRKQTISVLYDERLLFGYAILFTYTLPSLLIGFFYSRIIFELAAPALLVGIGGISIAQKAPNIRLSTVLLLYLVVAGGLTTAFLQDDPYQSSYSGLSDGLESSGISSEDHIFTDFQTGAYLVGEHQYSHVSKITSGKNRTLISSIWYNVSSRDACMTLKREYDSDYLVLRKTVTEKFAIENYRREPVPITTINRYNSGAEFNRVFSNGDFTVYQISNKCL
ncbi:hypothetical protein [Haloferax gibbonsii]|uniref:hypothetical protein n=1 Tax=Haloferax gibbonsii TaxID=35746 RepID=UPI0012E1B460|nr:hypothetical protein [Haloferax gibbonsii]